MMVRLLFSLFLGLSTVAHAAEPNRYAATISAAERFTVGDTLVERHGKGPAMILIPGLIVLYGAWKASRKKAAVV